MFIGFDSIINMSNASNVVAFDGANSAIGAIVAKVLRNLVLLISRKMNFRRAHDVDDDDERSKV